MIGRWSWGMGHGHDNLDGHGNGKGHSNGRRRWPLADGVEWGYGVNDKGEARI